MKKLLYVIVFLAACTTGNPPEEQNNEPQIRGVETTDLEKAIRLAREKGAKGISIFTADNLTEEQIKVFIKLKKEFDLGGK